MSTKADNIVDQASCWNRAACNEPVFVLRANDPIAPTLVHQWAVNYAFSKGGWQKMTEAQRAKFNTALTVAEEMKTWQRDKIDDDIPF